MVKANGYGHGAVAVGRAAVQAGADWLAVALVDEGVVLRDAGIEAPLLVLSEPRHDEIGDALATGARLTVYTRDTITALAREVRGSRRPPVPVHLKVDTGMHRVGATPADAVASPAALGDLPELRLEGVCTHLPVADEPDDPYTADAARPVRRRAGRAAGGGDRRRHRPRRQLGRRAGAPGRPLRPRALRHRRVRHPARPRRCGGRADLRPALTLTSEVSFVKRVPAGEGVSYGHRQRTAEDDGHRHGPDRLRRRRVPVAAAGRRSEVLVKGERRPMIGVVTMDQLMVDCGPHRTSAAGDEVVLLGEQGGERITPDEWAGRLGTIAYEVVCAIGARVARHYR